MSRDLDYQIAALLGDRLINRGKWKGYWTAGKGRHWAHEDGGPEFFSEDIAAAWRVVDYLCREQGCIFNCEYCYQNGYAASAYFDEYTESARTLPMAICLAALKAVEE